MHEITFADVDKPTLLSQVRPCRESIDVSFQITFVDIKYLVYSVVFLESIEHLSGTVICIL